MTENDFLLLLDAVRSGTLDDCPVLSQLPSSAVVMLKGSPITFDETSLASFLRQFVPGWSLTVSSPPPPAPSEDVPTVLPSPLDFFGVGASAPISSELLERVSALESQAGVLEESTGALQEMIDTLLGSEDE